MISFRVFCLPIAQPRQRHRIVSEGLTSRQFVQNYTPAKHPVNAFKASIRLAASQVYQGPPLEGPLSVTLTFIFPRPASMQWKKQPQPRAWHMKRPDAENVIKAFLDSLTGTIWRDDAQVSFLQVSKVIASGDEQPGVEVMIREASEVPGSHVKAGVQFEDSL